MLKRILASLVAVALLAFLLSACGSSAGGSGSTSRPTEAGSTAAASEPEGGGEESASAAEAEAELRSIIEREIFGRWGGTPAEFEVAGGACKIEKINTSEAAVKAGGEAVLDHERNASVLVAPLKGKGASATSAECKKAVKIAIG